MSSTSLQVFVHFKEETVFAGESVECIITFKNVETARKQGRPATSEQAITSIDPIEQLRAARSPPHVHLQHRNSTSLSHRPVSHARHPSALNVVDRAGTEAGTELPGGGVHIAHAQERKHTRTVSIKSLGTKQQRPGHRHARSVSVKGTVDANAAGRRHRPSIAGTRSITTHGLQTPSPVTSSPLSDSGQWAGAERAFGPPDQSQTAKPSNGATGRASPAASLSSPATNKFHFPTVANPEPPRSPSRELGNGLPIGNVAPGTSDVDRSYFGEVPHGSEPGEETTSSLTRVFSVRSMDGTPRSSLDVASTYSNDTYTSDLPTFAKPRLLMTPQLSRRPSVADRPAHVSCTESILMGYAQLSGHFTLDGSLVNPGPFEEVKRRAVVGGQGGGGVVGINQPKAESGLWGSLGWNSIGESLGGLIGASGPSTMTEMKSIAKSNSIPLLSTPKSILCVDLSLAPGESRSYTYQFSLPRGLPPSHNGRAIKVAYNLVVGTHKAGAKHDQAQTIKQVEVPFRVLSGVSARGEHLGHDLMSPYIILEDQARTGTFDGSPTAAISSQTLGVRTVVASSSAVDFEAYVDHLLTRPRSNSSRGLLSPTVEKANYPTTPTTPHSPDTSRSPRRTRSANGPLTAVSVLIDDAIRQSTSPSSAIYSPTNFTIARSKVPIASLTLSRPALKMGDTLTCVIDFSSAKLPCYALEATLESSEKVDPVLAIRSPQSLERATRRVWASMVKNTVWTQRCVFRAQVPFHATPAFVTSGVSLEWVIRLELVIGMAESAHQPEDAMDGATGIAARTPDHVLDVNDADERGTVLAAKQYLACESFEIEVPIRVLGAVVTSPELSSEVQGLRV